MSTAGLVLVYDTGIVCSIWQTHSLVQDREAKVCGLDQMTKLMDFPL